MKPTSLALLLLTFGGGCVEAHAQQQPAAVAPRPPRTVFGTGTLVADRTIPLAFERPGTLRTLEAEVGSIVERNAVLATLDDDETRLALRRDQAALASELAALARVRADEALSQQRITIARRESDRSERLFATGGAAELDRDRTRDAIALGQLELQSLRSQRPAISARVAQASARVELSRVLHERDRLVAPVRARVLRSDLAAGAFVGAGQPVVQLAPVGAELASVWVHESELASLRIGARATLTLRDQGRTRFDAVVVRVRPEADMRTHEVRVDLRPSRLPPIVVFGLRLDAEIERAP
jgi:multidrug efflux pump subunit AcrA (membrane-fusion protein)